MKKIWITSLVFIIIITIGLILSYIFNKNPEEPSEKNITKEEIKKYINDTRLIDLNMLNTNYYTDKMTNQDINKYLDLMYSDYFKYNDIDYFSKEEVDNNLKAVFGFEPDYVHTDILCNKCNNYHVLYDEKNQIYYHNAKANDSECPIIGKVTSYNSFSKKENEYILNLSFLYTRKIENRVRGLYASYNDALQDKNIVHDISNLNEDIEIVKEASNQFTILNEKLTQYIYTFKVEDDNIYFVSFEILE